jgi:hypothetical protein
MCFIRPLSFAFFQNRRPWCQSTTPQRAPSLPPSRRARLSTALRRGTRQRTGKSCSPWPGPVLSPPQAPGPVAAHTHTCGCLGSCRVVPVPGGEYRIACPFRPRACAFIYGAPTALQCPNGVQFLGCAPPAVFMGVHRGLAAGVGGAPLSPTARRSTAGHAPRPQSALSPAAAPVCSRTQAGPACS